MNQPTEGYIPFKGYKTFYKVFGTAKSKQTPLLVLHGGPGSAHNYLLGLAALTEDNRQVVFYDQLGCGKSDIPKDWDRIGRLPEITLPTLITSGQYDELTPWQAAITRNQIPHSRLNIITNGSHLAHIEQEPYYLQIVRDFLADAESKPES
jgi:pimeloyl-ACP methyl ester carboxylesterase